MATLDDSTVQGVDEPVMLLVMAGVMSFTNASQTFIQAVDPPSGSGPLRTYSTLSIELPVDASLVKQGVSFGVHDEKSGSLSISTEQWS